MKFNKSVLEALNFKNVINIWITTATPCSLYEYLYRFYNTVKAFKLVILK